MAGASGSAVALRFIQESVFGTTPATPIMKTIRALSGADLDLTKETFISEEVRSDRQIQDMRHGGKTVGGSIPIELSLAAFDDFIEGALGGTWTANVLKVGVNMPSYSIERAYTDINQFELFTGCVVNTFSLSIKPGAIVTGSFGFVGQDKAIAGSTAASSITPAPTHAPLDSFSGTIQEGGVTIATVTGIDLALDNGRAGHSVVGSDVIPDISEGTSKVTGSVTAHFADASLLSKFMNETESSIQLVLNDLNATDSFTIDIPRIKYTGHTKDSPKEGPIIETLPFQALLDAATSTNLQITRSTAV